MLLLAYLDFREVTRDKNRNRVLSLYYSIVHVLFGNSTVFSTVRVCFLDVCSMDSAPKGPCVQMWAQTLNGGFLVLSFSLQYCVLLVRVYS